jgi:hypothetical protein
MPLKNISGFYMPLRNVSTLWRFHDYSWLLMIGLPRAFQDIRDSRDLWCYDLWCYDLRTSVNMPWLFRILRNARNVMNISRHPGVLGFLALLRILGNTHGFEEYPLNWMIRILGCQDSYSQLLLSWMSHEYARNMPGLLGICYDSYDCQDSYDSQDCQEDVWILNTSMADWLTIQDS